MKSRQSVWGAAFQLCREGAHQVETGAVTRARGIWRESGTEVSTARVFTNQPSLASNQIKKSNELQALFLRFQIDVSISIFERLLRGLGDRALA